eukprot:scaffold40354_cov92-Phaeocystis_antarctica.AAC.2
MHDAAAAHVRQQACLFARVRAGGYNGAWRDDCLLRRGVNNYGWARLLSRRFKHGDNSRFPRRNPQAASAVVAQLIQTRTRVRVLAARNS